MKNMRKPLGYIIVMAIAFCGLHSNTIAQTETNSEPALPLPVGTFYSAKLAQPPLPFNPFPDLPVYTTGERTFVYDDREVDYDQIRAEDLLMQAILGESTTLGEGETLSTSEASGGLRLQIEFTGDNGRRMFFDTQPGLVYQVHQSSDLVNWTVLDRFVASETNKSYFAFDPDIRFYRVLQESDAIQFPNWHPVIEQSCYLDVYTPLQGTAEVSVYHDGFHYFTVSGTIPANGSFRVTDNLYNPANWPNDGLYPVTDWEFDVTITSPAQGGQAPAAVNQGVVFKNGRIRYPEYAGITVRQRGALGETEAAVEDELNNFMLLYFLANLQSSGQVNLDGALLNEFIDADAVPKLENDNDKTRLKNLMFATATRASAIDRLHYFGHGTNTSFAGIRLNEIHDGVKCWDPFTYVALDGCKTALTTDMLGEFTCYWKPVTRQYMTDKGFLAGFGCGWNTLKSAAWYPTQGALVLNHYNFWVDFYGLDGGLTHRSDNGNGYFDKTYQQAFSFAKDPGGNGVNPQQLHNPEATGFIMVGCTECFFDE